MSHNCLESRWVSPANDLARRLSRDYSPGSHCCARCCKFWGEAYCIVSFSRFSVPRRAEANGLFRNRYGRVGWPRNTRAANGLGSRYEEANLLKKFIVNLLKMSVSVAIIAYLIHNAHGGDLFTKLRDHPKNWGLLATAVLLCFSAVLTTMVRWCYLVRALDLPFTLKAAFRLGFLGYLLNLLPLGIVGGDLLKAVMLARQQNGQQAKAFASIVVDRLIGLYVLFVVASAAILLTGFYSAPSPAVHAICQATFLVTVLGAVLIAGLMTPLVTDGSLSVMLSRLPRVGHQFAKGFEAVRMYRRQPQVLAIAGAMSVVVHCLFASGVYCVARGLYGEVLPLATHYVVMPLSAAGGVVPLPAGPMEGMLECLYRIAPAPAGLVIEPGQGLMVAFGYRMIGILIAAVGVIYYLGSRQEVAAVMHEAEAGEQALDDVLPVGKEFSTDSGPLSAELIGES